MDAWVQLIRNALCCVKDLSLLQDTFLYDPSYVLQYYEFPEPLNQTTPLEVLIALAQLYVVVFTSQQGLDLVFGSVGKFRRIEYILEVRKKNGGVNKTSLVDRIVRASLLKEGRLDWWGERNCVCPHCYGNVSACAPLLHDHGRERTIPQSRLDSVANLVENEKSDACGPGDWLAAIEAINGWLPFWDRGVGLVEAVTDDTEERVTLKDIDKEKAILASALDGLHLAGVTDDLRAHATVLRWEGRREFLYFVLNLLAFYGYLVGIIVYFWHLEDEQPQWMRKYFLGNYSNQDADWHGNFLGDFMWTIEPLIILGSPSLLNGMRPGRRAKEKLE